MKALRIFSVIVLVMVLVVFFNDAALAQCAMCKGAISEKVNNTESNLGEGLNKGILYLMAFPYLIFGTIAFFWYRASKK